MIRYVALAVIAVASLTYAIVQYWEVSSRNNTISQLHREIAVAKQAREDAAATLSAVQQELEAAKANIARLISERDAAQARAKSLPGDSADPVSRANSIADKKAAAKESAKAQGMAAFSKMFESEEGRKMMKSQTAMATRMMYSDLAKTLKLSPQDAEQVMAMLGDRASAMSEGQFKLMGEGGFDEKGVKEMAAQSEVVKKEYDAKLKAILGDEKFKQMEDYEKSVGDRMALTQYEQQFNSAGVPLQPDQRDALLAIMSQERKNSPTPIFDQSGQDPGKTFSAFQDPTAMDRYFAQEEDYQRRVLAQATKTLSPDQVNALQQGFKQFGDMQKFGMKMMQEMTKEGSPGAIAPAPPTPVQESPK